MPNLLSRLFLLMLPLIVCGACQQEQASNPASDAGQAERPEWLANLIREQQEQPVANPPAKILQYRYERQTVYYLTSRCCDLPGRLYDSQGQLICEPDGGLTGQGDGRCPDFFLDRTDETLIWEDNR